MTNNMDVRDTFRKLATNKFIPDFDYKNYKLSFQTVFYTCYYKYCCCPCAFDHEWLAYISDSGEINEELYKKVEANLLAGKCPHVDHVISDYVRETAVYGIHFAAAVATEKAVKQDLDVTHRETQSSLFHVSPYILAVLKKNVKTTALRFKNLSKHFLSQEFSLYRMLNVVYPERSVTNENVIQLKDESLMEFCVRNGNKELLQLVLQTGLLTVEGYRTQLVKALGLAIRYNYVNIMNKLITFLKKMPRLTPAFARGMDGIDGIIIRIVTLDKPDILRKVLKERFQGDQCLLEDDLRFSVTKLCASRVQDNCYNVLCKYNVLSTVGRLRHCVTETHLHILFHLFDEFPDAVTHELEVIPDIQTALKGILLTRLKLFRYTDSGCILMTEKNYSYLVKKCNIIETASRPVIQWLLQQNVIVDTINTNYQQTPLISLLESEIRRHKLYFRSNLEILLYSNLEMNSSIFEDCIKVDENLFCKGNGEKFMFPQRYITDAKEHSLFGHSNNSDYALEFTIPLLLECGYIATEETLETALDRNLHPDGLKYIRAYTDTPRSLKLRCRDVLKRHFKGRRLHQFVEISPLPQSIKDFILLKTILNCV